MWNNRGLNVICSSLDFFLWRSETLKVPLPLLWKLFLSSLCTVPHLLHVQFITVPYRLPVDHQYRLTGMTKKKKTIPTRLDWCYGAKRNESSWDPEVISAVRLRSHLAAWLQLEMMVFIGNPCTHTIYIPIKCFQWCIEAEPPSGETLPNDDIYFWTWQPGPVRTASHMLISYSS